MIRHESLGEINFKDEKNGYECTVKLSGIKNKPSDYLKGEIKYKGKVVSTLTGSYLSHLDWDGKRYWDFRETFPISCIELEDNLPSSSTKRMDIIYLDQLKIDQAQEEKEKLEQIQRNDRKLREKYNKK